MDFENSQQNTEQSNSAKNRMTLIMLSVVFIAPVLLAYLAYFGGWFQGGGKSHGQIYSDPWHFDDLPVIESSFADFPSSDYFAKWNWLLIIDDKVCNEQCQINWFLLQQTQLGLGKFADRASYLLVLNQNKLPLAGEWSQVDYLTLAMNNRQVEVNQNNPRGLNTNPLAVDGIYLMDPMGNIFMRYDLIDSKEQAPLKSKDLRADINRVMRILDTSKLKK